MSRDHVDWPMGVDDEIRVSKTHLRCIASFATQAIAEPGGAKILFELLRGFYEKGTPECNHRVPESQFRCTINQPPDPGPGGPKLRTRNSKLARRRA